MTEHEEGVMECWPSQGKCGSLIEPEVYWSGLSQVKEGGERPSLGRLQKKGLKLLVVELL